MEMSVDSMEALTCKHRVFYFLTQEEGVKLLPLAFSFPLSEEQGLLTFQGTQLQILRAMLALKLATYLYV